MVGALGCSKYLVYESIVVDNFFENNHKINKIYLKIELSRKSEYTLYLEKYVIIGKRTWQYIHARLQQWFELFQKEQQTRT